MNRTEPRFGNAADVFEMFIEERDAESVMAFTKKKVVPLIKKQYPMLAALVPADEQSNRNDGNRVKVIIAALSKNASKDFRRTLRSDPDIWFYSNKFGEFHCAPISMKPVKCEKNENLYELLVDTANANGIYKNVARIAHNKILKNGLLDTWRIEPVETFKSWNGVGPKMVELILLARGENPEEFKPKDYTIPDISSPIEEILSWNDETLNEFTNLRNTVLRYSRHPESIDRLINFAFDLGCEWQSATDAANK